MSENASVIYVQESLPVVCTIYQFYWLFLRNVPVNLDYHVGDFC